MPEESQVDPQFVARINQKLDDLRCVVQIIVFLIIFVSVIQIVQILTSPSSILSGFLFYIIIVLVLFLSAAICFLRTDYNKELTRSLEKT